MTRQDQRTTGADARRSRQVVMAEQVIKHGSMTVEALSELTGVSLMTVYRDIAQLEEAGVLVRNRGRVSALASGLHEAGAQFRLEQHPGLKGPLAAHAAKLIPVGSSISLDDSTSGVWLIRAIDPGVPMTVVTNSFLVAREIVDSRPEIRLYFTGGEYQPWAQSVMGPATVASVQSMRTDFCVLSASGIANGACFHPYEDVAQVKKAMLAAAQTTILLLDHTKFERRALHVFTKLADISLVLIDDQTPTAVMKQLDDWGTTYEVVKTS